VTIQDDDSKAPVGYGNRRYNRHREGDTYYRQRDNTGKKAYVEFDIELPVDANRTDEGTTSRKRIGCRHELSIDDGAL
jgi:hypothetical protein